MILFTVVRWLARRCWRTDYKLIADLLGKALCLLRQRSLSNTRDMRALYINQHTVMTGAAVKNCNKSCTT